MHDPQIQQLNALEGIITHPDLLPRIRDCMKRWAGRYAISEHAQKHVKETQLLIQEIDEVILRH